MYAVNGNRKAATKFVQRTMKMNPKFSNVNASDVFDDEKLRQSELVNRLAWRIQESPFCNDNVQKTISEWLLDNDMQNTRR